MDATRENFPRSFSPRGRRSTWKVDFIAKRIPRGHGRTLRPFRFYRILG